MSRRRRSFLPSHPERHRTGRIGWLRMLVAWVAFAVFLVIVFSMTR